MPITFRALAVAVALSGGVAAARADVWDAGAQNDNSSASENELISGASQVHDMAAQQGGTVEDIDWFPVSYLCYSHSFEVLLDGITGSLGNAATGSPALELLDQDATTVLAGSSPASSLGIARRLTFRCQQIGVQALDGGPGNPTITNYVRVSHPACGLGCVNTDQYRVHFRETTARVARFNNSATQVSILVLQNSTSAPVGAVAVAHDATGAAIASIDVTLGPNQVMTLNLSTAAGGALAGKGGALNIVNDAPYGTLAGKVVAVEPATGFTFDTPLVYKPPEK